MSVPLTIELPDDLAAVARAVAGDLSLEDAVIDWITMRVAADPPVADLSDEQVLALADSMLSEVDQEALSDLLAGQREGQLTPDEKAELDRRMVEYRWGQMRKAQGLVEAIERGLRPRGPDARP